VPLRTVLLGIISALRFIVTAAFYVIAVGFVALFAFEFVRDPKVLSAPLVVTMDRLLAPYARMVSSWFGWLWPRGASLNFAPLILAVAIAFIRTIVESVLLRIDFTIRRILKKPSRVRYSAEAAAVQQQHHRLTAETEQQRAVLLKRYREIEDALKSASRKTCSFLSIDVVGSTKMKIDERKTAIDATFQAYEELVKETFEAYGVWKETWTPDGVMACFLDRELAVTAAKQILSALEAFNRDENQLRTPIKVRCGLNEGDVAIFEDSALEKVADHAIDIAGHMQKYADEDALQISDAFYEKLSQRDGFSRTDREVDGFTTYQWKPPVAVGVEEAEPV
jgi:class 3 adenylate cyclase